MCGELVGDEEFESCFVESGEGPVEGHDEDESELEESPGF